VIFTLIQMFNDGEFDEVFNIPKEDVDEWNKRRKNNNRYHYRWI
jgi:hypothetical protein